MEYDVFISCKSEDYVYAEEIYDFLTENGINTFLASRELRKLGDSEYRRAISQALKSAYHMIVFASNAEYIDSPWVFYEWDLFINAKLTGAKEGQLVTILKDVKVKEINLDLCKYESFKFERYKDKILSYVETPSYIMRKKQAQKVIEENQLKEKLEAERRKAEKLKADVAEVEKMLAKIESDESLLSSDRQNVLKKIEQISDATQKQKLTTVLNSTGAIHKAHKSECDELESRISATQSKLKLAERKLKAEKKKAEENEYLLRFDINRLKKKSKCKIISIIILSLVIIGLTVAMIILNGEYNSIRDFYYDLRYDVNRFISNNGIPITITDVNVGNVNPEGEWITKPGKTINSEDTQYLKPQIKVISLRSAEYTIRYKLYCNGYLSENTKDNPGYTSYPTSVYTSSGIEETINMRGWGNDRKGHWPTGDYKIEIWYEGICLKTKEFVIE